MPTIFGASLTATVIAAALMTLLPGGGKIESPHVLKAAKSAVESAPEFIQTTSPQGSLADQLKVLIRPRLPSEMAFIAMVVQRVDNGTLPRDLVVSTMLWARQKQPYPYPYFERGLRLRASAVGIQL